ncbi:DUF262 domain-containing protein, partial [uncultured Muribaculum sp.]|uniref:GmrSD restriction endonuclease domain-containing protein n=1 Tax=uncultured Muribaculum sp. TaxID=1918613 RepID=UPI0033A9454D
MTPAARTFKGSILLCPWGQIPRARRGQTHAPFPDGNYEMIDGQQRTLSICEFRTHGFNIEDPDRGTLYFSTLTKDEQEKFLNYELTVYFCEGTDKEKLDWFRVINIAGEKLLDQELLNAVYT